MRDVKTVYYTDELRDEFSAAQITPITIDEHYRYERNALARFFWYRCIATPLAFLYTKLALHHSWVNAAVLRPYRKTGYFIFGNHTHDIGDPLMPNMFLFPQRVDFVVHPNNVSMPTLGKITPYLGAIPLPDDLKAYRNFFHHMEKRLGQHHAIVIYPEAHIWPYCTWVRHFPDTAFGYPVKLGAPVFCFTNTYQKRRFSSKPRVVTYIDGPFFPDESLSKKEQQRELRERVYNTMRERAKNSTVELVHYIKKT